MTVMPFVTLTPGFISPPPVVTTVVAIMIPTVSFFRPIKFSFVPVAVVPVMPVFFVTVIPDSFKFVTSQGLRKFSVSHFVPGAVVVGASVPAVVPEKKIDSVNPKQVMGHSNGNIKTKS